MTTRTAWWGLRQLSVMPTLAEGQADDLKVDGGDIRVWLARTSVEDGEPYRHTVHVEVCDATGVWRDYGFYDAQDPPTVLDGDQWTVEAYGLPCGLTVDHVGVTDPNCYACWDDGCGDCDDD